MNVGYFMFPCANEGANGGARLPVTRAVNHEVRVSPHIPGGAMESRIRVALAATGFCLCKHRYRNGSCGIGKQWKQRRDRDGKRYRLPSSEGGSA